MTGWKCLVVGPGQRKYQRAGLQYLLTVILSDMLCSITLSRERESTLFVESVFPLCQQSNRCV